MVVWTGGDVTLLWRVSEAEKFELGYVSWSSYLFFIAGFLWTLFGHSHLLTRYNSSQSFNVRCTQKYIGIVEIKRCE